MPVLLLVFVVINLDFTFLFRPKRTLFLKERRYGLLGAPEDSTKVGPVSSPAIWESISPAIQT